MMGSVTQSGSCGDVTHDRNGASPRPQRELVSHSPLSKCDRLVRKIWEFCSPSSMCSRGPRHAHPLELEPIDNQGIPHHALPAKTQRFPCPSEPTPGSRRMVSRREGGPWHIAPGRIAPGEMGAGTAHRRRVRGNGWEMGRGQLRRMSPSQNLRASTQRPADYPYRRPNAHRLIVCEAVVDGRTFT
jgi:hypothetical protein